MTLVLNYLKKGWSETVWKWSQSYLGTNIVEFMDFIEFLKCAYVEMNGILWFEHPIIKNTVVKKVVLVDVRLCFKHPWWPFEDRYLSLRGSIECTYRSLWAPSEICSPNWKSTWIWCLAVVNLEVWYRQQFKVNVNECIPVIVIKINRQWLAPHLNFTSP